MGWLSRQIESKGIDQSTDQRCQTRTPRRLMNGDRIKVGSDYLFTLKSNGTPTQIVSFRQLSEVIWIYYSSLKPPSYGFRMTMY